MKFKQPTCPTCGKRAGGALDWIPGMCRFDYDEESGHFDHNGYTKMFWEGSTNESDLRVWFDPTTKKTRAPGLLTLVCSCGKDWETLIIPCHHPIGFKYTGEIPCTGPKVCITCGIREEDAAK